MSTAKGSTTGGMPHRSSAGAPERCTHSARRSVQRARKLMGPPIEVYNSEPHSFPFRAASVRGVTRESACQRT